MNERPKESDWKKFRGMVVDLRERYLREKNRELAAMLSDPGKTATEQFWETMEKMEKEQWILEECLDGHSRSKLFLSMGLMCRYGMLRREDLENFSPELQEELSRFLREK